MRLEEWRRALRVAVATSDESSIVALIARQLPEECLQAAGAALLTVSKATNDRDGAARVCIDRLRGRGWEGDAELITELEIALGDAGESPLRPVQVDLEELADILGGGLGEDPGVLDLRTGAVWPAVAIDYARETNQPEPPPEPDGNIAIAVWPQGSDGPYRDMRHFIARLTDEQLAEKLSRSLQGGKGAFRRFRHALESSPTEFTRWHAHSDDRRLGRARAWLANAGLRQAQRSDQQ